MKLGFCNLSFFGKYVRENFGVSPSEYRKQVKEQYRVTEGRFFCYTGEGFAHQAMLCLRFGVDFYNSETICFKFQADFCRQEALCLEFQTDCSNSGARCHKIRSYHRKLKMNCPEIQTNHAVSRMIVTEGPSVFPLCFKEVSEWPNYICDNCDKGQCIFSPPPPKRQN